MDSKTLSSIANLLFFPVAAFSVAYIANVFIGRSIDLSLRNLKRRLGKEKKITKTDTIGSLLKSIISIAIFIVVLLMILSHFGINTIPLLTSAGIIGLTFSLGAQSLVKDIIAGFFIIFENQFNIGDRIKVGSLEGRVYKIGIRITQLKDKAGNIVYIPNSQITTIVKFSK